MADPFIEIDLTGLDLRLRLDLDSRRVQAHVGRKLAAIIRKRIKRGTGLRSGQTLDDTGKLIRSIKYDRREGVVRPSMRTRTDVSRRAKSNFGLMKIHVSGKYRRRGYQRREFTDPMGSQDSAVTAKVGRLTERAIAAELKSGRGGLIAELKGAAGLRRRALGRRRR